MKTLEKILRLNIRMSDVFMGDLHAQLAACTVGARRLGELVDRYTAPELEKMFAELIDRSEKMTVEALRRLPEGTFKYVDWLDNDGVDLDRRVKVEVAVTISDGKIHFDLTGTNAQVRGPIKLRSLRSSSRGILRHSGFDRQRTFRRMVAALFQSHSTSPRGPSSTRGSLRLLMRGPRPSKRLCGAFIASLAEAIPEIAPASSAGLSLMMAYGGVREDGSPFIVSELVAGGSGGSLKSDGVDCIQTDGTNSMNMPVEAMALEAPIRVERFELRPDSGGPGRGRGGLGIIREYRFLADTISFTHRGERHYTAALGAGGGEPGAMSQSTLYRNDGRIETISSKTVTIVNKGDRLVVENSRWWRVR